MAAVRDTNKQRKLWIEWLEAINQEAFENLTASEESFICNLNDRLEKYGEHYILLSDKEEKVLENIYAERTK